MSEPTAPLLGNDSIGAIADLARSASDVERVFKSAGIPLTDIPSSSFEGAVLRPHVSQRVSRTLKSLDLTDRATVHAVLTVAARLAEIYQNTADVKPGRLLRLRDCLAEDGFHLNQSGDPLAAVRALAAAAEAPLSDASAIRAELTRLERHLDEDPSRDIGTAKRLIESTAKVILVRQGVVLPKNPNMPGLVKDAMDSVGAWSEAKPPAVQKMMDNLRDLALAVNNLRNKMGDGHGGTTAVSGIDDRDGRLAVRAAIAWCAYLLDALNDFPEPGAAQPSG